MVEQQVDLFTYGGTSENDYQAKVTLFHEGRIVNPKYRVTKRINFLDFKLETSKGEHILEVEFIAKGSTTDILQIQFIVGHNRSEMGVLIEFDPQRVATYSAIPCKNFPTLNWRKPTAR